MCRPEVEDEDEDEAEVGLLGEVVSLPAAKKVVPKGSVHPRGKTGLPHCTPDAMGLVRDNALLHPLDELYSSKAPSRRGLVAPEIKSRPCRAFK